MKHVQHLFRLNDMCASFTTMSLFIRMQIKLIKTHKRKEEERRRKKKTSIIWTISFNRI